MVAHANKVDQPTLSRMVAILMTLLVLALLTLAEAAGSGP